MVGELEKQRKSRIEEGHDYGSEKEESVERTVTCGITVQERLTSAFEL